MDFLEPNYNFLNGGTTFVFESCIKVLSLPRFFLEKGVNIT